MVQLCLQQLLRRGSQSNNHEQTKYVTPIFYFTKYVRTTLLSVCSKTKENKRKY